ncbi:hypothetical protein QE152_g27811 [Popillia japonica]|uniref:Uncharacterized protein n=1 Tax=Popillia japonica TaxID=7064 RepID=A0AAW1JLF8_POPJA
MLVLGTAEKISNAYNNYLQNVVPELLSNAKPVGWNCNIPRNNRELILKPVEPQEIILMYALRHLRNMVSTRTFEEKSYAEPKQRMDFCRYALRHLRNMVSTRTFEEKSYAEPKQRTKTDVKFSETIWQRKEDYLTHLNLVTMKTAR